MMNSILDKLIPKNWGTIYNVSGKGEICSIQTKSNSIVFESSQNMLLILLSSQSCREIILDNVKKFTGFTPAGHVELILKERKHCIKWNSDEKSLLFCFDNKFFEDILFSEEIKDIYSEKLHIKKLDKSILYIAKKLEIEIRSNNKNEIYINSLYSFLTIDIFRNNIYEKKVNNLGGLAFSTKTNLIKYINDHMSSDISLDDLSIVSGYSKSHLIRAFRQTFGQTPHQYIIERRLEKSLEILTHSHISIREAAKICGFSSNSHLTECFKKAYGETPQQFRNKFYKNNIIQIY